MNLSKIPHQDEGVVPDVSEPYYRAEIVTNGERLRKVILDSLEEGNPFSTIEWEFDSQFDDVAEKNREVFVDIVIAALKSPAE